MAQIHIVYGSVSGNTELVVEKTAEILSALHSVTLLRAKTTTPEALQPADLIIFASPTYGHGQLENYMAALIEKIPPSQLKGQKAAVIGLGDPKYDNDYLIESAKILIEFLKKQGAELVGLPLMIAKNPLPQLEIRVKAWAENLTHLLT